MPFISIQEFLDDWKYESEMTMKIFAELSDESLQQKVTPNGRSLGKLAWHITYSITEMMGTAGIIFESPLQENAVPGQASQILASYKAAGKNFVEELTKKWTDKELKDEVLMYGENWAKSKVLIALIGHQTHHRGQMTVLMRQAGLKVPGAYGPSFEEWGNYGAEPQE